jgi:hypothetical protein
MTRADPPADPPDALDALVARLEHAAQQLRAGDLPPERAAALVDDCARIAAEAGAELDRRVRAGDGAVGAPAPGQLALGS